MASSEHDGSLKVMNGKDGPIESPYDLELVASVQAGDLQKPQKPFTLLSAAALGYAITNTGAGILLVVGNSMFGAGPLFFYGSLLIAFVSASVAISLGELASAYPHAGGQYFWVARLAPPKFRRFFSYLTAIISWASVVCIGASAFSGSTNVLFQMVALTRPDFVYHQWMGFLVFEALNVTAAFFNLYERFLPTLSKTFFVYSVGIVIVFFACLLAPGSEKQTAAVVFGADGYFNLSGWPDGVAFLIGVSGVNWGFSCLDAITHLAEEIPEPRKNIPVALLSTVIIGLIVSIVISLAIFFIATDLPNTTSILSLLYSIYNGNPTCAYVLGTLVLVSAWTSGIGIHTWGARIAWSLSRDKGFPFHSYLATIAPAPFHTPLWAHFWTTSWIALCGFLYLGSLTAFNAFVAAAIVLQYLTYAAPVVLLLIRGRKNFKHGPFWWPKLGLFANVIVIAWTLVTLVIYSFPLYLPVEAASMNYLSCVVVFAFLYAIGYWLLYGSENYCLVDLQVILE